jgi:hypothetical protein
MSVEEKRQLQSTTPDLEDYGTVGSKEGDALPHGENSVALTAGIIVADVVGAGILSMAVAIAKFGWLLGTILTVVLLAMNVHVSIIVWRVRMKVPGARTYMELAEGAFSGAPPWQQQFAVRFTGITQQLLIAGFLGVYTLSLGKGFGMLFLQCASLPSSVDIDCLPLCAPICGQCSQTRILAIADMGELRQHTRYRDHPFSGYVHAGHGKITHSK